MARLDHPHIVRLIGVTQSPSLMIVMEIAPLGPLNKFLKKNLQIKIVDILILMMQVRAGPIEFWPFPLFSDPPMRYRCSQLKNIDILILWCWWEQAVHSSDPYILLPIDLFPSNPSPLGNTWGNEFPRTWWDLRVSYGRLRHVLVAQMAERQPSYLGVMVQIPPWKTKFSICWRNLHITFVQFMDIPIWHNLGAITLKFERTKTDTS